MNIGFNFINFSTAFKMCFIRGMMKRGSGTRISRNHRRIGKIISGLSNRFEIE